MIEWFDAKKEAPTESGKYLTYIDTQNAYYDKYDFSYYTHNGGWYSHNRHVDDVKYWAWLDSPEEDENEVN